MNLNQNFWKTLSKEGKTSSLPYKSSKDLRKKHRDRTKEGNLVAYTRI